MKYLWSIFFDEVLLKKWYVFIYVGSFRSLSLDGIKLLVATKFQPTRFLRTF